MTSLRPDTSPRHGPPSLPHVGAAAWWALISVMAAAFVLELCLGSVLIPPRTIWAVLSGREGVPDAVREIVLLYRLPRAFTAMLGGAALGMAGLKMQTLFRNPLADPFVLGISSGAGLGVALVVFAAWGFGFLSVLEKTGILGNTALITAAAMGSATVLCVIMAIARRVENTVTLLIVGLMFGYIGSALVNVLLQFALEHQMQSYIAWTFGSFGGVTWRQLGVFSPVILAGLALAWVLVKPLNALLLGEGYARSMGVNVRRTRTGIILGASILSGTVTATCGPIGFLGIAVPHLCRLVCRTSDHRILVPAVILTGAALALLADMLAQAPGTRVVLPLNSVTSLIGAPVVIGVILRGRRTMETGT